MNKEQRRWLLGSIGVGFLAIYLINRRLSNDLNNQVQTGLTGSSEWLPAGSNTGYLESIPGNPGSLYNTPSGPVIGNPGSTYETGGYTSTSPASYVQGGTGFNNIDINTLLAPTEAVGAAAIV